MIGNIKEEIENLSREVKKDFRVDKDALQDVLVIIDGIEESWSGSWIGFHADFYFENFEKPPWNRRFDSEWGSLNPIPSYWRERIYEDIVEHVASKGKGISIENIRDRLIPLMKKTAHIHKEVCIELSFIRGLDKFHKEIDLLDEIENHEWGTTANEYVKEIRPKQVFTRDMYAMNQGIRVPPHIQYKAQVVSFLSVISSIERFIEHTERLLRQLKIRGVDKMRDLTKVLMA